jgi:hypothetical protein
MKGPQDQHLSPPLDNNKALERLHQFEQERGLSPIPEPDASLKPSSSLPLVTEEASNPLPAPLDPMPAVPIKLK